MPFSRKSLILKYVYCVRSDNLERVDQVEDFRFKFTGILSFWDAHTDNIVGKALRVLKFIKQHTGFVISGKCILGMYLFYKN